MQALWTGSISFGLVNIPVRMYSAVKPTPVHFHFLHKKDMSPVRFAKFCKEEEKEIPYSELVKGYEYKDGHYVVVTKEELKKANVKKSTSMEIVQFSDAEEIELVYGEQPYFLGPDKTAGKAYSLLCQSLAKAKKVAICKFVLHEREYVGAMFPWKDSLVLNRLRFDKELRDPSELKIPEAKKVSDKELKMAESLIEQLTSPFDPTVYTDEYHAEVEKLIAQKIKGKTVRSIGKAAKPTPVGDLMAALRASLETKSKGKKKSVAKKRGGKGKVIPIKRVA